MLRIGPRAVFAVLLLLIALAAVVGIQNFRPGFIEERVTAFTAGEWLTPLDTGKREDWNSLLISSKGRFLAERISYAHLTSHVHTGVDLQNRLRGGPGEPVYAAARGKVYDVKLQAQGTRVTIEHLLPNGEWVYTSYIHVGDVRVRKGMRVDFRTVIARRFNKKELHRYGMIYNHLHFQIHKREFVPEHTIATSTPDEAERRFYDPAFLFRNHYQEVQPDWKSWLKKGKISIGQLLYFLI